MLSSGCSQQCEKICEFRTVWTRCSGQPHPNTEAAELNSARFIQLLFTCVCFQWILS
ncbi:hypothetical protein NP493_2007g00010 [Ridgeia piscesae]|uniref:Uncharacterized protein n=1 Tax=Ridgeia piscesae TaxID=27915 RepID=A0AAD9JP65_RIDPI|nr:hypothetical protein NP493_2007g00010 [Ridgeia piscesae]